MKIKLSTQLSKKLCEFLASLLPRYKEVLRKLYVAPLGLTLELEATKNPQTQSQRAYFHACLPIIAAQIEGTSPNDLKLFFKYETWGKRYIQTSMGEVPVIPSSAKAKRAEYSELIETMHRLCAENGYHCPEPEFKERKVA